ncbi:hypothetical protein [Cohnella sp. REN36]|uniref:hypothetical protein n=1 Tax=Cohnella sp. REN36 TaxID=2887347 RepID=UPI00351CC314
MVGMLNALAEDETPRQVTFVHAARNGGSHALRAAVEDVVRDRPNMAAYAPPLPCLSVPNLDRPMAYTLVWTFMCRQAAPSRHSCRFGGSLFSFYCGYSFLTRISRGSRQAGIASSFM